MTKKTRVVLNLNLNQAEKLLGWLNNSECSLIASDEVNDLIQKVKTRLSKTIDKHYPSVVQEVINREEAK